VRRIKLAKPLPDRQPAWPARVAPPGSVALIMRSCPGDGIPKNSPPYIRAGPRGPPGRIGSPRKHRACRRCTQGVDERTRRGSAVAILSVVKEMSLRKEHLNAQRALSAAPLALPAAAWTIPAVRNIVVAILEACHQSALGDLAPDPVPHRRRRYCGEYSAHGRVPRLPMSDDRAICMHAWCPPNVG
jgi:hypothetical protein